MPFDGAGADEEPGAGVVPVSHRLGTLFLGDAALVVAVGAPHRCAAFAACAHIVEAVKDSLPVWNRQVFTDGTSEWVNSA